MTTEKIAGVQGLVRSPTWQRLRRSLVGTWADTPEKNVARLRRYLGKNPRRDKLRIVLNYLTGTGFRTGKISHPSIDSLLAWVKRRLEASAEKACAGQGFCAPPTPMPTQSWQGTVELTKRDDEQRLVFGWLYVSKRADGSQVVDHSGETVSVETLERAAYNFVLDSRRGGLMHKKGPDGKAAPVARLVECIAFTPEKRKALGIADGTVPDGMWVGFKIDDDEAWEGVKSGKYRMLSLGGRAIKRTLEET